MKASIPACLALAALVACDPVGTPAPTASGSPPAAAPETTAEPTERIDSAERLAGEYRVAGVDGAALDLPHGVTASITAERISVVADCIRMQWSYRFDGGVLATRREPVASCRRALLPEEQAIGEAFDAATAVEIDSANGYEFTGGGRSVTLFTQ